MLISIDHGNKQIKTVHKTFTSGLCESNTRPPFGGDVLFYNGKYYTLSDQRIPYMRDKTADERFLSSRSLLSALNCGGCCHRKNGQHSVMRRTASCPLRYAVSEIRAVFP